MADSPPTIQKFGGVPDRRAFSVGLGGSVAQVSRKGNVSLAALLRVLLPAGGYVAIFSGRTASLQAYFDESMTNEALPLTSVSGYLFEPEEYLAFEEGMKAVLRENDLSYFRMVECLHLQEQFAKYPKESKQPGIIETEVIRLTRKHAVMGVGGVASEALYNLIQPAGHEDLCGAYAFLCQWCLAEIGRWCDRHAFTGDISYFFEAGCADQIEANRIMNNISLVPDLMSRYRFHSHTFVKKGKLRGLEAADMLAWFIRRQGEDEEDRRRSRPFRTERRKDFQALIGRSEVELREIEHRYKFFDEESLRAHFSEPINADPAQRWY